MEEAKVCVCVRTCARGCVRACVGVWVGGWGVSVCVGVHVRAYMCVQFLCFFFIAFSSLIMSLSA